MAAMISTAGARSAPRYRVVILARSDCAAGMVTPCDDGETPFSMSPMRKDPFAKQPSSNCFAGWTDNGERSIFLVLSIASMSRTTPVPSVTKHGPISGPGRYDADHRSVENHYDQRHRSVENTYDCRHWRAGRRVWYTTENKRISHRWGYTHEIQACADHPNAIHPITRLGPSLGPLGRLWFRLCWLFLRCLEYAASHPAQLASAHGDLWGLARDLSYRTTTVRGTRTSGLRAGPVLPGLRLPVHPLAGHERLLAPGAAAHHDWLDDADQTTVSQSAAGLRPLPEFLPRDPPHRPSLGGQWTRASPARVCLHPWIRRDHPRT